MDKNKYKKEKHGGKNEKVSKNELKTDEPVAGNLN